MYRKITVAGNVYEYVVGRSHTKIKGLGVWPNSEIGEVRSVPQYCECCGEPLSHLYSSHVDPSEMTVTPAMIARKINGLLPKTPEDTFLTLRDGK